MKYFRKDVIKVQVVGCHYKHIHSLCSLHNTLYGSIVYSKEILCQCTTRYIGRIFSFSCPPCSYLHVEVGLASFNLEIYEEVLTSP